MQDGYFLSISAHVSEIAAAYALTHRHDQAMALWHRSADRLTLVRYWEFERLTGRKSHALAFPDAEAAHAFIAVALEQEGLALGDLQAIVGTPGLGIPGEPLGSGVEPPRDAAYHSICHLYSGLLLDTSVFQDEKILCLSLDAGPDRLVDQDAWDKPHYLGAFSDRGKITLFPVMSPALLWAVLRERTGLAEGTLMALGRACEVCLELDPPAPPEIRSIGDRFGLLNWLDEVWARIHRLIETVPAARFRADRRFTDEENRAAALVKVVQDASLAMVCDAVETALARFDCAAPDVHLSMVGGFALNCPINAELMRRYGFRSFIAPPTVNDSGIALGMGLHYAAQSAEPVTFRLATAFHGRRHDSVDEILARPEIACHVERSEQVGPDRVSEDIIEGPVVWFSGAAEIGPRALGHRSLLADPRRLDHKDRLNRIKRREWWRPVAPIIRAECAAAWFAMDGPSPFMLQAVPVREDRRDLIPAVCHLDGTARVQTLSDDEDPDLSAVIRAFEERSSIPMLCNTSLNDKGEPIIDDPARALVFAAAKGIRVVYLNGTRVQLVGGAEDPSASAPRDRPAIRFFTPPARSLAWLAQHNPHGLSRAELVIYFSDPRFSSYDLARAEDVRTLRRLFQAVERRHGDGVSVMLTGPGVHLEAD